jgi:murein L,D-transpeptidase YcbB/YkuD
MKKNSWIAIISAILIIAIILAVAFRKQVFQTSGKGYTSVKNTHNQLTEVGAQAYYRAMLIDMFSYSDSLGIDDGINHISLLKTYDSLVHAEGKNTEQGKVASALFFTNSATAFLYQAAYGDTLDMSYNGVQLSIDSTRITNMVARLAVQGNWQQTLDSIEPQTPQYALLKLAFNRIKAIVKFYPAIDSADTLSAKNLRNSIILKLKAYGIINLKAVTDSISDDTFSSALRNFQKIAGIDTSGKQDKQTIENLQFPLAKRLTEIKRSLNFWRWSNRLAGHPFILVNIAAARLRVINDSLHKINMRVIPGQSDDQTPLFTAYFTRVTTYPYWVVPFSIETKEMLPRIQKSISYLEKNSLEVMDLKGHILNASAISWYQYSKRNFPFVIRQQSGCEDALGILQFSMSCPFDIYLHDTDFRELFNEPHRFLSHGCVRVQNPVLLAQYLLDDKFTASDSAYVHQCLKGEKPKGIAVVKKVAAIIYYMTADISESGALKFYRDVYGLEK